MINFLLNGRSVLLEMPKKSGGKITSHLLSAHGGEIFIHSLNTSRSCLEEPPSISEGGGGRVTDYRINDFGQMMQLHRIVPLKPLADRMMDENLLKMRTKLAKNSRYWPLTLGTTILYNVRQFVEPILMLTHKPDLTEEDVMQCQKTIFQLASLEGRQESLALPNMGHRLKGAKREEQYRLLWAELELNVSSSGTSPGHKAVLKCIRDCRSRAPIEIQDKDEAAAEAHRASVIRATTDSPMSPPHTMALVDSSVVALLAGSSRGSKKLLGSGTKSLFDILSTAERAQSQKRIDFSGRLCTPNGQVAKLYPNLGMKEESVVQGRQPDVK